MKPDAPTMTSRKVTRVGVAANLAKEPVRAILHDLVAALAAHGLDVYLDSDLADEAPALPRARLGIPERCDAIVAIGGDGTILKYARRYADHDTAIVGVKGGRLGFLAESDPARVVALLSRGDFDVQERMRVLGVVRGGAGPARSFSALNDLVIHSTGYSRMVGLRVEIGGKLLREFSADGLIVATPTGSSAYSLSAGGPILLPEGESIVLTPICPHTLTQRPLVLPDRYRIEILVLDTRGGDVHLTVDGQVGIALEQGDRVTVARSAHPTRLLVSPHRSPFAVMREKLRWGER
jgi:NAD+ kinase